MRMDRDTGKMELCHFDVLFSVTKEISMPFVSFDVLFVLSVCNAVLFCDEYGMLFA